MGTNPDVTSPTTVDAIKTALQKVNSTLNSDDLNNIKITAGATLLPGQAVKVSITT